MINYSINKIIEFAKRVEEATILYDLEYMHHVIEEIKGILQCDNNIELFFAVKANRNYKVIDSLAQAGIGFDIASMQEYQVVHKYIDNKISATGPSFTYNNIDVLLNNKVKFDFDNFNQLCRWRENSNLNVQRIGVRVKLNRELKEKKYINCRGVESRFGIDIFSNEFLEFITREKIIIERIHIHIGEYYDISILDKILQEVEKMLLFFPCINSINWGGGYTYIAGRKEKFLLFGSKMSEFKRRIESDFRKSFKFIFEPGMLLIMASGYLVSKVLYSNIENNVQNVVLNTSSWNLMEWVPKKIICIIRNENKDKKMYTNIYGCSCYEDDIFVLNIETERLMPNDIIVWGYSGGYVSSMMRSLHGFTIEEKTI